MTAAARGRLSRTSALTVVALAAAFLTACSTSQPKGMVNTSAPKRSKEYFSEAEYGVKASPRVTDKRTRLPRGGGRDLVGKPYKIKGKWYKPKEDKSYSKVGAASWYGDAFHGRLTANGEIYDMTHLTAAHPTMPLPSYARVTNMVNGASIIVRVNDRGPYSNGRIIDLSKRAAELLDYTHTGVAKVKVDYVGRAPLHGRDEQYLMASYRPNGVKAAPSPAYDDGLPAGVMVAMDGRTPSVAATTVAAVFPSFGVSRRTSAPDAMRAAPAVADATAMPASYEMDLGGYPMLPDYGPIVPERPSDDLLYPTQTAFAVMSYADQRVKAASDPFALVIGAAMTADDVAASWTRRADAMPSPDSDYVMAGSFSSRTEAERVATLLAPFGTTRVETGRGEGAAWHAVTVMPRDAGAVDTLLQSAWQNGAPDAFLVRR
ncbi:MAG: septal ring lytic transglycosylase RlpA family protein [Rhizobiaceae bacterium]|nr:septal ring lytic transglycosylase RlpA family protein [Rhizobiaceae bacterium]